MTGYSLNLTDLASYPGVTIPNSNTGDLVKRLTEGKINGILDLEELTAAQMREVDPIALEVAARSLRNPTGATSVTEGIDDWKQTLRWEGEVALARRAGIYLTDDEKADLRALVNPPTTTRRRTMSIGLRVPGVVGHGHRY